MSTHRLSLIVALGVIAAVAVLTISMVAAPHPSTSAISYEAASQNSHQISTSESFGRYVVRHAAVPQNPSQLSIARAQRLYDLIEMHGDALQGP